MEIKREKDSLGYYTISLLKDDIQFRIYFGGNGDLYWDILNMRNMDSSDEFFILDKSDGAIYELFYKLYMRVINHQVFQVREVDKSFCRTEEDVKKLYKKIEKDNEELYSHAYFKDLCSDGCVVYHSDNEPYETGNRLTMFLDEASGELSIEINRVSRGYDFLDVCFTHSGSRYSPFDLAFYEHYSDLCEIDLGKMPDGDEGVKKLIKQ